MKASIPYYEENGAAFVEGSVHADMSGAYAHFLPRLPAGARILDLGCGSGRDSLEFLRRGYRVVSADGSSAMCAYAQKLTGQEVLCLRFEELDFRAEFDGVWACASLLHVGKSEMPGVLRRVARALKPGGIAYLSYKYGTEERESGGRSFSDYTERDLPDLLPPALGLELQEYWITQDVRPEREERWLNVIAEKGKG